MRIDTASEYFVLAPEVPQVVHESLPSSWMRRKQCKVLVDAAILV